ncbi:MAG: glutamate-5-semialdehyde dehydrogenase [Phormidesmis sp.]
MIAQTQQPALSLTTIAQQTQQAARQLAQLSSNTKNQIIESVAQALEANADAIATANQKDLDSALASNLAKPLYGRLKLDKAKLKSAIQGVRSVARLSDPTGEITLHRELDQGLVLKRIGVPLGVLGIIFESRPDAVMQISTLALKSGNGVILKGGREAIHSCTALVAAIRQGIANAGSGSKDLQNAVQLLTTREETNALLALDKYVDLIIPRGSNQFVQYVQANTRIPVLGHADGICHLYIDSGADLKQATSIAVDAKVGYPSACNAIETLLVNQAIAPKALPILAKALQAKNVELRGDTATQKILPDIKAATEADWSTEYSDLILAIRIVESTDAAIDHINTYGSRHTEAISTTNLATAKRFMAQVDAAGVYHNCSTRFADGFRYGFGAEVGISTQKMPPRGPVGLEGLVTYKYQLVGEGHIVATYSGAEAKAFTHRDL